MTEKIALNAYDQIRLTKLEDGSWSVVLKPKDGGFVGRIADSSASLDEAVAKIKERYIVDGNA